MCVPSILGENEIGEKCKEDNVRLTFRFRWKMIKEFLTSLPFSIYFMDMNFAQRTISFAKTESLFFT